MAGRPKGIRVRLVLMANRISKPMVEVIINMNIICAGLLIFLHLFQTAMINSPAMILSQGVKMERNLAEALVNEKSRTRKNMLMISAVSSRLNFFRTALMNSDSRATP